MGFRAADELQASGVRPVTIDATLAPEQAVLDFVEGKLKPGSGFCRCHE
jgi:hypothetical protein